MKNFTVCALSLLTLLPAGGIAWAAPADYQLEQVLLFSRHNLRAPLATNGSVLEQATRKPWPQWQVAGGELTTKGGILEVYMGNYTRAWLAQQGLIKADACPDAHRVFAYANSLQRTVATAQYFVTGAFPGCDIAVTHQDAMGTMDPIFNPVIANGSEAFQKAALTAMQATAKQQDLTAAWQQLDKIVDYKNSPACKGKKGCSLESTENSFSAKPGAEPGVSGGLRTGNALVDAFTLQYYEGFPADQVAWGQIKTPEQWQQLSAIKNGYQDALFTSSAVAADVVAPLLDYLRSQLMDNGDDAPQVTLMVGHDSNIASLLSALKVKPWTLPGQYEKTPIGGQVVFQRWLNKKTQQPLLKVEYVYQTADQLRNATPLSLKTPPQRVTLQLEGCTTDANGFCDWQQFSAVLNDVLKNKQMQTSVAPEARAAADSAAQDKAAQNTTVAAQAKAAAEKAEADRIAAEKAAKAQAEAERVAAEKAAEAKASAEKAEKEQAAADREAAEQAAKQKAAAQQERAAGEKAAGTAHGAASNSQGGAGQAQ
nr:bifunctional glucose-1-phosphatase/inositol phosphatase [Pantoea sp. 1.19]